MEIRNLSDTPVKSWPGTAMTSIPIILNKKLPKLQESQKFYYKQALNIYGVTEGKEQ